MDFSRIAKSPAAIAFSAKPESGLRLLHYYHKNTLHLDMHEAVVWNQWRNNHDMKITKQVIANILENNFAIHRQNYKSLKSFDIDSIIPRIAGVNVKWYSESPDLIVIYNTTIMTINNPLLVLGPYGSLIWRGIIDGHSIGQLRHNANIIFGNDETISFLKRLFDLGFINIIESIEHFDSPLEELIKEFPAPFIQYQIKKASIPWYCLWEICSTCNMNCKTCYLPNLSMMNPSTEASMQIADRIIDAGIFHVTILGGEPLTREDLELFICKFRKAGVFVKIISNGKELNLERANKLYSVGLNQIEFSLDGLSPSTHEISRGRGSFNLVLRAISNSKKANIPRIGIVLTLYRENCHEIQRLPEFMKKLGVTECYISLFRKIGGCGKYANFTPIERTQFQIIRNEIDHITRLNHDLTITILSQCTCGETSLVISAKGNVRPCPFRQTSAGNLYDETLIEIWDSIANRNESGTTFPSPEYCKLTINA